jgi:hypothetical protein
MRNRLLIFILLLHFLLGGAFFTECFAQKKFELGLRFDGLNIQFDNTYEGGLGTYDINTKRNITQAGYADFIYWPHRNLGISLTMGFHDFRSEIQYSIPDPFFVNVTLIENSDRLCSRGLGYFISAHFRKEQFRVRIAYGGFDLHWEDYPSRSGLTGVHIFDPDLGELARLTVTENSYWLSGPMISNVLQLDGQYRIIDQLHLKLGFEATLRGRNVYPYSLKITGFTQQTTMDDHLFNDFRIRNMYTAVSMGIAYYVGFGSYRKEKETQ